MKRRLWLIPLLSVGIGLIQTIFVQTTQEMAFTLSNSLGMEYFSALQIMSVVQAVFALILILASGLIFLRRQTRRDMAISALITSVCFLLIGLITEVLFYTLNYIGVAYQFGSLLLRFMRLPLAAYFSVYTCLRNLLSFRYYFFMGDFMRFVYLVVVAPLPFINVLFAWGKGDDARQAPPQPPYYNAGGYQPPYGDWQGYAQPPYQEGYYQQPPYQNRHPQQPCARQSDPGLYGDQPAASPPPADPMTAPPGQLSAPPEAQQAPDPWNPENPPADSNQE